MLRLRDRIAPNVLLGYHLSVWGTGVDIPYSDPPTGPGRPPRCEGGAFYRSLHAHFDVAFAEFDDRDSGFNERVLGDGGASWWNAGDFSRHVRFLSGFVRGAHRRVVLWQIPLGNTRLPDTWGRYRDNRVEWLLDGAPYAHLRAYARAGVLAFLFGGGADGTTSARTDGGVFFDRARAYLRAGAVGVG